MALIKYLFEIVLATIIIFFVWNILKRLFFNAFYKNFPFLDTKKRETPSNKPTQKPLKEKLNWDAETVEYEEIKEEKKN